jgi:hypothetical protein
VSLIVLTSASGSPGVTTTALGLALGWPRPAVLVEADPTGGSAIAAGYLRGEVVPPEAMIDLALAQQRSSVLEALPQVCQTLPGTTTTWVPSTRSHEQARTLLALWEPLAAALRSLEATGQDVIVDAGRLGLFGHPEPLVNQADLALLVIRTDMVSLSGARSWAETLRERFSRAGGQAALGVLLVGEGRPFHSREVARVLQLPGHHDRGVGPPRGRGPVPRCAPTKGRAAAPGRGPRRLGGLTLAAQLPGGAQRHYRPNPGQRGTPGSSRGGEADVTSEPVLAGPSPDDPTALPALFTSAPVRSGRTRSDFSMRPRPDSGAPVPLEAARRRHAANHPEQVIAVGDRLSDQGDIDWGLVAAFRTLVATRLAQAVGGDWRARSTDGDTTGAGAVPMDRTAQEQFGWAAIEDLLSDHTTEAVATGVQAWTPRQRALMAQAIFDAVFRLGRLQPLVDDDRVENIFILGHQQVLLELVDGSRIEGPQVADSDEELIDFLRFLANRSESNPRPFSEGTPRLHMKLDGGARLAATAWVVSRPTIVIRRHRLKVDSLEAWIDRGCISPACANLLGAVVRAAWSVAVLGRCQPGRPP